MSLSVIGTQRSPYEEHRGYVLRVLGRRCGWLDASDREALLHDAYAVFLEKQRDGHLDARDLSGPQIRAYLTQTALNKAMDEGKRASRRRSVSLDDEDLGIDPADPGRAPDDLLASGFDDARVREIVAELPQRQQLVIKLRFFFNRTPHEIQRYMGITERVYRRELERATRKMAERFELVRDGRFCDSRRSLILAYVTGVAGPNRMREARRHLDTCPACANWAAELRTGVRRAAAAFVPAPLLELPVHHERWAGVASAAHHLRERIVSLAAGARGHAMRGLVRVDASRISVVSGTRPSAVAVLVTGCLAGGSAATYCAVNALPALRSLVGASRHSHHHPRPGRQAVPARTQAAVERPPVSARQVSLVVSQPPAATHRRRPAASRPHAAPVRHSSPPVMTTSTPPPATQAQRVHESTAPEFGAGGGSPVTASSSSGNNAAPPPPSKAMPEFDP
jgi:RNA polymerase sigma factor (sigma-70 family)